MLDNLMALLLALLSIAFGLFCGVNAIQLIHAHIQIWRLSKRSKDWRVTDGYVVGAALERVGAAGRSAWKPMITYTYRVNGVEHQGSRLAFDYFKTFFLDEAEKIMERYKVNTLVKVFYDADQPQESALDRSPRDLIHGLLFLPLFLSLPTALCVCVGLMGLAEIWNK